MPAGSVDALAGRRRCLPDQQRARLLALTAERSLPAIFPAREFAVDGGLASYGTRWADMPSILGSYAGRLLKGAPRRIELRRWRCSARRPTSW